MHSNSGSGLKSRFWLVFGVRNTQILVKIYNYLWNIVSNKCFGWAGRSIYLILFNGYGHQVGYIFCIVGYIYQYQITTQINGLSTVLENQESDPPTWSVAKTALLLFFYHVQVFCQHWEHFCILGTSVPNLFNCQLPLAQPAVCYYIFLFGSKTLSLIKQRPLI